MYNPNLHFYFIGIGGSGMSGIAEILLTQGFKVTGSDVKLSAVTKRLEGLGAKIHQGHSALNITEEYSLVVYSSAIVAENPEMIRAYELNIPVIRRAEVLAELMRLKYGVAVAGSHGKTSTTTMIAAVMEQGRLDPTVIVGGIAQTYGSASKLGKTDYLVAESDESDRSFLLLKPTIAVVTNIDEEHLSAYSSIKDLENAFFNFISAVPFYGLAVLCSDDARVRKIIKKARCRFVTYGENHDADIRGELISISPEGTVYNVFKENKLLGKVNLSAIGRHFMLNSLASIAVGLEFGIDFNDIKKALACFKGVKRRIEVLGTPNGVTLINDYAHHPTEIKASLKAIKDAYSKNGSKIHLLFQPHRYSRTKDCIEGFKTCFAESDNVYISEIYAAGEKPIIGVDSKTICKENQHNNCNYIPELKDGLNLIKANLKKGDVVVCMGAGSVGSFAEEALKII